MAILYVTWHLGLFSCFFFPICGLIVVLSGGSGLGYSLCHVALWAFSCFFFPICCLIFVFSGPYLALWSPCWARERWLVCFSLIRGLCTVCQFVFSLPFVVSSRLWSVTVVIPGHLLYWFSTVLRLWFLCCLLVVWHCDCSLRAVFIFWSVRYRFAVFSGSCLASWSPCFRRGS